MKPVLRKHYQESRETLERYRDRTPVCIWVIGFTFLGAMFLRASGLPYLLVALLGVGVLISAVQYWYHLRNQLEEATLWCECEGYENYASFKITDEWVCGFCGKTHPPFNIRPSRQTFLDKCENVTCKERQHSIICFRCRQPVVWDEDAFRRRPNTSAWFPDYPPLPPEPVPVKDRPPRPIDEDLR
jgi:hypothetical protein